MQARAHWLLRSATTPADSAVELCVLQSCQRHQPAIQCVLLRWHALTFNHPWLPDLAAVTSSLPDLAAVTSSMQSYKCELPFSLTGLTLLDL